LKELNLAEESLNAFILPVMLDEMKIPDEMRYQLAGTQFIAYHIDSKRAVRDLVTEITNRKNASAGKPKVERPAFREVEVILENETLASFKEHAQQKLLAILAEVVKGSITDAGKAFIITKIEEISD
jgi:hypothetical protein